MKIFSIICFDKSTTFLDFLNSQNDFALGINYEVLGEHEEIRVLCGNNRKIYSSMSRVKPLLRLYAFTGKWKISFMISSARSFFI